MAIQYYWDLVQGTDEWLNARLGLMTASEMKLVLTPTLKIAKNDKVKAHAYELAAQRLTQFVEPHYFSDDMMRGTVDEIEARNLYASKYAPVKECGFITNDKFGFKIGYSPDGLVGAKGAIEAKSRRQKYQIETIVTGTVPDDYLLQVQTAMLVAELEWVDFISYSAGLPMFTFRAYPNEEVQNAIITAASQFEETVCDIIDRYADVMMDKDQRLIPTERKTHEEDIIA